MHNKDSEYWLEGIRARTTHKPRSIMPYMGERDTNKAVEWYGGWDTADIILTMHNAVEPA
jgi:hypothetical protein